MVGGFMGGPIPKEFFPCTRNFRPSGIMTPASPLAPPRDGYDAILDDLAEMIRLDDLPLPELIHEVFGHNFANKPVVRALVRRLDPDWGDRYDNEGNPTPESGLKPFPKPVGRTLPR
jgi:hypothetical protein